MKTHLDYTFHITTVYNNAYRMSLKSGDSPWLDLGTYHAIAVAQNTADQLLKLFDEDI